MVGAGGRPCSTQLSRNITPIVSRLLQEAAMTFPEALEGLFDALKQTAPVLVLLSTIAVLWWRSAHLAR